jgi:hypothetical protein
VTVTKRKLPNRRREAVEDRLTDIGTMMEFLSVDIILGPLPEKDLKLNGSIPPAFNPYGDDLLECEMIAQEAEALAYSAGLAAAISDNVAKDISILGTVSPLTVLAQRLDDNLEQLMMDTASMRRGIMPPSFYPLTAARYPQLYQGCGADFVPDRQFDIAPYAVPLSVSKAKGLTALLQIEVEIPCVNRGSVYGNYILIPTPYQGQFGPTKLQDLKTKTFWAHHGDSYATTMIYEHEVMCPKYYKSPVPLCTVGMEPGYVKNPQAPGIKGHTASVILVAQEKSTAYAAESFEYSPRKAVVATTQQLTATMVCPSRPKESILLKDVTSVEVPPECWMSFKEDDGVVYTSYQSLVDTYGDDAISTRLPLEFGMPQLLTFAAGKLWDKVQEGTLSRFHAQISNHIEGNLFMYLAGASAAAALGIGILLACIRRSSPPPRVRRAGAVSTRTRQGRLYVRAN